MRCISKLEKKYFSTILQAEKKAQACSLGKKHKWIHTLLLRSQASFIRYWIQIVLVFIAIFLYFFSWINREQHMHDERVLTKTSHHAIYFNPQPIFWLIPIHTNVHGVKFTKFKYTILHTKNFGERYKCQKMQHLSTLKQL